MHPQTRPPLISPALSSFLDVSRWMAAWLVVMSHARHLLLKDYELVKDHSLWAKFLYLVTGLGHEAVVIFFVVSGFLVGGLTLEKWWSRGTALAPYAFARIARIYTVFLPALALSAVLDIYGANFVDASGLYADPRRYHTILLQDPVTQNFGVSIFFGNIAMLQKIKVPVFGSNGPLWSLAYEWWYYVLFAIAAAMAIRPTARRFAAALTLLAACLWLLPAKLLAMGALWLFGLLAFYLMRRRWSLPRWGGLTLFLAALAWSRLGHNIDNVDNPESLATAVIRDGLVALGYCAALLGAPSWTFSAAAARCHSWLAGFSYSLYLVHFPMLVFLASAMFQWAGWVFCAEPTARSVAYLLAMLFALLLYGWAFAQLTERHTAKVRFALDRARDWTWQALAALRRRRYPTPGQR